ncbi:MAG TPA: NAD(P)/FAD-dependent oxidoreductase [Gemmataceae bacterium]|nr:NAD(P)/FAD-dependent oxidoreductase [Gemmataceae bacterium]
MAEKPEFTIVGAGLAGALLACHLGKAGRRVDVYERRPDPRGHEQERGRSINLALSVRGIEGLRAVGLADEVLRDAIPMRGRMIHSPAGELAFQPYGKDPTQAINSVSRAGLNLTLITAAARYDTVRLFFQQKCTGIDLASATVELADTATYTASKVACESVIAADGAYSAVRGQLQKHDRFNYHQDYETHGYKELTIPPAAQAHGLQPVGFALEKHALHIWPRHSFMMIALPNLDGSFTCTLFWPYEGPNSFAAIQTEADLRQFFEQHFTDALPLMPTLAHDFFANPVGPLVTIRCSPWHLDGRVALLGDAAHAVVPFLGQGMNAAFEDCTILDRCLAEHPSDRAAAFRDYETQRKPHTDALAEMCVDNFLEMRDRVSSPLFRLGKKLGILLHRLFPRWYVPLYTLITFTTTPYAAARRRAGIQDRVVRVSLVVLAVLALAIVLYLVWP